MGSDSIDPSEPGNSPLRRENVVCPPFYITFHTDPGDSFMALWDADNDGVWGGGTSVFTEAPLFLGDSAGAALAADKIMEALGTTDWVSTFGSTPYDSFAIPVAGNNTGVLLSTLTTAIDGIFLYRDSDHASLTTDTQSTITIFEDMDDSRFRSASFAVSAVPVPAAVWLFGSGLLGLIGVARRKARA